MVVHSTLLFRVAAKAATAAKNPQMKSSPRKACPQ